MNEPLRYPIEEFWYDKSNARKDLTEHYREILWNTYRRKRHVKIYLQQHTKDMIKKRNVMYLTEWLV